RSCPKLPSPPASDPGEGDRSPRGDPTPARGTDSASTLCNVGRWAARVQNPTRRAYAPAARSDRTGRPWSRPPAVTPRTDRPGPSDAWDRGCRQGHRREPRRVLGNAWALWGPCLERVGTGGPDGPGNHGRR